MYDTNGKYSHLFQISIQNKHHIKYLRIQTGKLIEITVFLAFVRNVKEAANTIFLMKHFLHSWYSKMFGVSSVHIWSFFMKKLMKSAKYFFEINQRTCAKLLCVAISDVNLIGFCIRVVGFAIQIHYLECQILYP